MNNGTKLLIVEIIWWFLWTNFQMATVMFAGYDWQVSLKDAAISNFILGWACYAVIVMLRYYQPTQSRFYYLLLWSAALAIMQVTLSVFMLNILNDDPVYSEFLDNSLIMRFGFSFLMLGFVSSLSWVWYYMQTQQQAEMRKADMEKMSRDAELFSLRQQLQPHFLFNSLNSINALIGTEPEKARQMVHQLSDFFRGTLKRQDSQRVTLSEELDQLTLYLEIEKVRFGHRLKTEVISDEVSKRMMIPSLLLQPVVENAIKFGLYDVTGEVLLKIHAMVDNSQLKVCVENPFDPETAQPLKGTGFGLKSIERRLYLLYGRNDLLTTEKENLIYRTCLLIPQS